jgi:hypothetical protein
MRRIEKITLRCFRGATGTTELLFDPNKPIALLFGENGTGKSTVIDAIDLICNGQVGSLQGRSSANEREHLASIGHPVGHVSVGLQFGGSTWSATHNGRRVNLSGSGAAPTAHVLRRSQLLRLVEAQPAKRYEELRRFIEVDGVEQCETALGNAARTAESELNQESRRKIDAEDDLRRLWIEEGSPGAPEGSAMDWAAGLADADTDALKRTADEIDALLTRLDALQGASKALGDARDGYQRAFEAAQKADTEADAFERAGAGDQIRLVELLKKAQECLDPRYATGRCPVCQQPVEAAKLRVGIAERLSRMDLAEQIRKKREAAARELQRTAAIVQQCENTLVKAGRTLVASATSTPLAALERASIRWSSYGQLSAAEPDRSVALKQAEAVMVALSGVQSNLVAERDAARKALTLANTARLHRQNIRDADQQIGDATALKDALARALSIVHDTRIAFSQDVLDGVADEWNRLYDRIHPDEPVGNLRLYLDENRRGSLHQDGSFCGHEGVAPQGYFSDAHLDTLGFCLFVALAKADAGNGDSILVLDDVFTSVDQAHLARVSEVLHEESEHFNHLVIATHLRAWQERYRQGSGPAANVQLLSLRRWTIARGVCADRTKLAVEDLADTLAVEPLDRRGVASQAGVLLEFVLDHLTLQYRCSLPRTPEGVYTLGALCDGTAKLAKQLRIERPAYPETKSGVVEQPEEVLLKPFIDKVSGITFIRNWVGAHYNALGSDISDGEVEGFGKAVLDLLSALVCPVCGDLARRPDGSYWRCECRKTRMFPLAAP